jgi:hypothetical protein
VLKSGASDAEIHSSIEDFKEKFADYGRDRRSAMEFHLRNVERLLMPTTTTSVAMRALEGGDGINNIMKSVNATNGSQTSKDPAVAVAQNATTSELKPKMNPAPQEPSSNTKKLPKAEPKEMFKFLVEFLEVTPEQSAELKDSRHVAKELDDSLAKSMAMLEELKGRLTAVGQDLDAEFTEIRSILTPRQAAKFLVWVANNGGTSQFTRSCLHMHVNMHNCITAYCLLIFVIACSMSSSHLCSIFE